MLHTTGRMLHVTMELRRRVLLLGGRSTQETGLARGVRTYVDQHELPWQLEQRVDHNQLLESPDMPSIDGVIGFINDPANTEVAEQLAAPVAIMGGAQVNVQQQARVLVDEPAIGQMAAEQARRIGCAHLALVSSWAMKSARFQSAVAQAKRSGVTVLSYDRGVQHFDHPDGKNKDLIDWLHHQPKPLLVFCYQDREAVWLSQLCRHGGIAVPDDVAILGVDDDTWQCEQATPPLSSIHIPWSLAGFRLAGQMHRLLSGSQTKDLAVTPLRITERASTQRHRVDDPLLSDVCQHLEQNIARGERLNDVVKNFGVSRQTLFRRFKANYGINLNTWWLEHRLARAADMLSTNTEAIAAIGKACGFRHPDTFRQAFVRRYGQPPSLYRALHRSV